ncbi:helix-turn-helix domain-containing protein, partial [bacterium]|nr:helix-turn-helix domain-containing protein [bacterium]
MTSKLGGPFLPFPRWALKSLVGDSTAKAVLLQLLVFMDPDSQVTTTSYEYVAEQVGVDRRTVMRAVKRLESIGVLVKKNRRGVGRENNLSNLYRIRFDNPEVFEV